jgi:cytochrome c-type biogenesis protein CcmE
VDKSIFAKPDTLEYRFQIQSNGKVVAARYTGVIPDTFKDGSEVVLKGQLTPHGFTSCRMAYAAANTSEQDPGAGI